MLNLARSGPRRLREEREMNKKFKEVCKLAANQMAERIIEDALNAEKVKGVMISANSPGGTASDISDFMNRIEEPYNGPEQQCDACGKYYEFDDIEGAWVEVCCCYDSELYSNGEERNCYEKG
jgi:hypothetical protein